MYYLPTNLPLMRPVVGRLVPYLGYWHSTLGHHQLRLEWAECIKLAQNCLQTLFSSSGDSFKPSISDGRST